MQAEGNAGTPKAELLVTETEAAVLLDTFLDVPGRSEAMEAQQAEARTVA
jgi:hypothetical protein